MILSTIDIYAKAWSFVKNMIDIWVINDKKQSKRKFFMFVSSQRVRWWLWWWSWWGVRVVCGTLIIAAAPQLESRDTR